jgi:hypothetical protein
MVKVASPFVTVVGVVRDEKVRVAPLDSVVVIGAGGGGGGWTGGWLTPEVAAGGGWKVKDAPPVTRVEGTVPVKGGRVVMLVPIWITLPLTMMVCPSEPVVVTALVGGGGGGRTVNGGMKVKVWLPVVTVMGAVPLTMGTGIVWVPLTMMSDALDTMGAPPASVHVVAGILTSGAVVVPGAPVGGVRPMVEPEQVVRVMVVVT